MPLTRPFPVTAFPGIAIWVAGSGPDESAANRKAANNKYDVSKKIGFIALVAVVSV